MIGETVGSYRVVSQLGEGGMGVVYLAEHTLLGKRAAVKVLRPELSAKAEVLDRFFNEARAATVIAHPGIIEIFDFGHHASGVAYIIMEYLDGESLSARLRRVGATSAEFTAEVGRQAAAILGVAHEAHIVHRDIKPDNIFLLPSRELPSGVRVKVLDFGIAKLSGDLASNSATRTGALLGTPNYMSPEQCRGAKDLTGATDIYALGCVLFEMLAGRPPYVGEGLGEVMVGHLREPVPHLGSLVPGVHPQLAALVERCLAKDPFDRPRSMEELEHSIVSLGIPVVFDGSFPRGAGGASVRPTPSARTPSPSPSNPPQMQALPRAAGSQSGQVSQSGRSSSLSGQAEGGSSAAAVTTLSSSAGQVQQRQGGGKGAPLWAVGAVVLLAGAGGGAWMVSRSSGGGAASAPAPAASAAGLVAAPAGEAPVALPAKVKLTIKSTPSGAEVRDGKSGTALGVTPLSLQVTRAAGEIVYQLHLDGYEDAPLALDTSGDGSGSVTLRAAAPSQPPAATAPAPSKGHARPASGKGKPAKAKPGGGDLELFDN